MTPHLTGNAEIHMYMGFCMGAWSKVDEQLFKICTLALGCSRKLAAIVYYKSPTLESRLELANELVRAWLPLKTRPNGGKDHVDVIAWDKILSDVKDHQKTRRRIAHSPVSAKRRPFKIDPKSTSGVFSGEVLLPPQFAIDFAPGEILRGKVTGGKPLTSDDLSIHAVTVQKCAAQLEKFRETILSKHTR